jgi:hypothetical protein
MTLTDETIETMTKTDEISRGVKATASRRGGVGRVPKHAHLAGLRWNELSPPDDSCSRGNFSRDPTAAFVHLQGRVFGLALANTSHLGPIFTQRSERW